MRYNIKNRIRILFYFIISFYNSWIEKGKFLMIEQSMFDDTMYSFYVYIHSQYRSKIPNRSKKLHILCSFLFTEYWSKEASAHFVQIFFTLLQGSIKYKDYITQSRAWMYLNNILRNYIVHIIHFIFISKRIIHERSGNS